MKTSDRPVVEPELGANETLALRAAEGLALYGEPLSIREVVEETGLSESQLTVIRKRLRARGLWPWPNIEPGSRAPEKGDLPTPDEIRRRCWEIRREKGELPG